jgi:hypothetical protein
MMASEVCPEINNECHSRFLSMLGHRYGWVPPANPAPSLLVTRYRRGQI